MPSKLRRHLRISALVWFLKALICTASLAGAVFAFPVFAATTIIQQQLDTSQTAARTFEYFQEFYPEVTAYATTIGLPFGGNGSDGANCYVELFREMPGGDVLLDTAMRSLCQNKSMPPFNLFLFPKMPLLEAGTKYKWVYNTGVPTDHRYENSTVVWGSQNALSGGGACSAGLPSCSFTLFESSSLLRSISFDNSSGTVLDQDAGNQIGVNVVSIDPTVSISLFIADPGIDPISGGTLWTSAAHISNPTSPLSSLFTVNPPAVPPNRFYAVQAALVNDAGNILATSTTQDFFVTARTPLVSSTSTVIIQEQLDTTQTAGVRSLEYSQEFYPAATAYATTIGLPFSGDGADGMNCYVKLYEASSTGNILLDTATRDQCSNNAIPPFNLFTFSKKPILHTGTKYKWVYNTGVPSNPRGSNATVVYGTTLSGIQTCSGGISVCAFVLYQDPALLIQPKEPVIIVPGVAGSILNRVADGQEVWPNAKNMVSSPSDNYLDILNLDTLGQELPSQQMLSSTVFLEATGTANLHLFDYNFDKIVYKNLLDIFSQEGYIKDNNLFTVPYDWRLDVNSQTNILASKINQAIKNSPTGKVNIIAHSLGGLLVKQYLVTTSTSQFVDKVVLVGVPQLGAPQAFKDLIEGDNFGITFGPFDILNPQEVRKISQNMPAIYQLLPSRKYIQNSGSYVQDFRTGANYQFLNYDQTTDFLKLQNFELYGTTSTNGYILGQADTFHKLLDNQPINAPSVYNIVGCLNPTISNFKIYDNNVVDIARDTGDGTVPMVSAMNLAANYQSYFILGNETGIQHMDLVADSRPLTLIKSIIDGTVSTSSLPQGISVSTADCLTPRSQFQNETTIEFSTHSPVALHVYDSQGRHTGPLPNGDIELGIPGSQYEKFGENSFVLVPASDTYKIIDQATASGTFMMKVKGYAGSAIDQEATYLSMPIQSTSTKAELDFSGFRNNMGLKLDKNGDGVTDITIQPTAILSASSSADIVPPTLAMPQIPNQVLQFTTSTFSFTASDSESGVATSSATLNGIPVKSGQIVTFTKLGKNTFHFEAQDFAGNPIVRDLVFTVFRQAVFSSSADTYIRNGAPNQNQGAEKILSVRVAGVNRSLVKFDQKKLRAAIASGTIISATLEFTFSHHAEDFGRNGGTVDLYRLTHDWIELGVTWNCPNDANAKNSSADCASDPWQMGQATTSTPNPWAASSTASALIKNGVTGAIQFDVANDVRAFLSGGVPNDGWILKKTDENASGRIEFGSRESSQGPRMKIVYAP